MKRFTVLLVAGLIFLSTLTACNSFEGASNEVLEQRIMELQAELHGLKSKVTTLEDQVSSLENELSAKVAIDARQDSELANISAINAHQDAQIATLELTK